MEQLTTLVPPPSCNEKRIIQFYAATCVDYRPHESDSLQVICAPQNIFWVVASPSIEIIKKHMALN
jgi:hypothetical protein